MTFWKRQNYEESKKKKIIRCHGVEKERDEYVDQRERIFRAVKLFYVIYHNEYILYIFLTTECTTVRMNPNVKYEFQVIMISRSIDCNKCCTVMQMSIVGKAEVGVGKMGVDRNSICAFH